MGGKDENSQNQENIQMDAENNQVRNKIPNSLLKYDV